MLLQPRGNAAGLSDFTCRFHFVLADLRPLVLSDFTCRFHFVLADLRPLVLSDFTCRFHLVLADLRPLVLTDFTCRFHFVLADFRPLVLSETAPLRWSRSGRWSTTSGRPWWRCGRSNRHRPRAGA